MYQEKQRHLIYSISTLPHRAPQRIRTQEIKEQFNAIARFFIKVFLENFCFLAINTLSHYSEVCFVAGTIMFLALSLLLDSRFFCKTVNSVPLADLFTIPTPNVTAL